MNEKEGRREGREGGRMEGKGERKGEIKKENLKKTNETWLFKMHALNANALIFQNCHNVDK